MMKNTLMLVATLALAGAAHAAERDGEPPRLKAIEQSIEATSGTVRLPDRTPASFFARTCETCPTLTLQVTPATRFFLGKNAVPQTEFNLGMKNSDPAQSLGIFYDSKTLEVTRVVAFGLGDKPAANTKSRRGK